MAGEYVFNLQRLTKQHDRVTVLDNITLAFFFGAKIGVIGGNGSGKSTLLRIMAGIGFLMVAVFAAAFTLATTARRYA